MIKRVLAMGFFDGVHLAHGALLSMAKKRAGELSAIPSVMTFDAHPSRVTQGDPILLLNNADGRADLISRVYGIEDILFVHFDEETRETGWREFLDSLLCEFGAIHLIAGYDFRFGYKGEGNAEKLREYCNEKGIGLDIIPELKIDGERVSSTYIRELIKAGDIEKANSFLGHPHCLVDIVRYGYKLGRTLGFPTVNMQFPRGVISPPRGVYASRAYYNGKSHIAVTNVGTRPTVSDENIETVESFLLDFKGNLYGKKLRIDFYKQLRLERQFDNIDELKK
ncbi:riboflavin biosynthesis protein RibF, partial [Clostridiaceae bacterium OttesenSCG-928-D20]|nr:riboflavin biosynthesis protein RibF [Clostridiaceae bacterium OttesenSCG-928-D20]